MIATLLAADISLPSEDLSSFLFMGKLVLALGSLLGIAYAGVSIYVMLRRKPTVDDHFATKRELTAVESRLLGEIRDIQASRQRNVVELHGKIDGIRATMETVLRDFARDIGGLEGVQKMHSRLATDRRTREEAR